jgi:hypothetical protein
MLTRSHTHLGSQATRRRRRGLFTLAGMAGLLALVGGNATMAAAGGPAASQVVRAGAKAIGRSSKPKTPALVSLHSSQPTGAVTPSPAVYLVFWGSQWSNDPAKAASALQSLFNNLYGSQDTWGTILDQYCEGMPTGTVTCAPNATFVQHPTSPLLKGVWLDNTSAAPSKATASQIAGEAVSAAAHFSNTTPPPNNLNAQYVIASPSGTHPDGFPKSFCAWHSSTTSSYGNIAYTNLPYVPDLPAADCTTIASPGPLDGYESTETHEYAESVTDPFPSNGWLKGSAEIADLCENQDAHLTIQNGKTTATFDVQGLWSNAAGGCVTSG